MKQYRLLTNFVCQRVTPVHQNWMQGRFQKCISDYRACVCAAPSAGSTAV